VCDLPTGCRPPHQIQCGDAPEDQPAIGPHLTNNLIGLVRVQASGLEACQTKDHSAVCRVASSGQGQRSIKRHPNATRPRKTIPEPINEPPCSGHRPHGVRTGRAYSQFEKIKDADVRH